MKKDVELMNRFELLNEVERLKRLLEHAESVEANRQILSAENRRLNTEVGRLYSQQTIIAQYFDALGQQPGMQMWLDVADDLRCNRLVSPKFHKRASKRKVTDRRTESQGRRKKTRRI